MIAAVARPRGAFLAVADNNTFATPWGANDRWNTGSDIVSPFWRPSNFERPFRCHRRRSGMSRQGWAERLGYLQNAIVVKDCQPV